MLRTICRFTQPAGANTTMPSTRTTAVLAILLTGFTFAAARAAEPTGTWLTEKGDAHIRVAHCGKALCGTIIWIKDKIDAETGKPPVDSSNPDPRKRHRRIVGLRIFAMTPNGHGQWAGDIYNSDDGKTYDAKLIPHGGNRLEVKGCVGLICGSETWRKLGR